MLHIDLMGLGIFGLKLDINNMRSTEEIQEAKKKVKENLNNVSQYTGFGDDKHAALDAIYRVLDFQVFDDEIDEEFEDDYVNQAAYSAIEWLEGDDPIEELLYTR